MLCENCKKNTATTYFKQTVNGNTNEIFLCSECASKLGLGDKIYNMGFDFMMPKSHERSAAVTQISCPDCKMTLSELSRTGRVGCANCYENFKSYLSPALQRYHGNKKHIGKFPISSGKKREVEDLKKQLEEAIANENFEQAAVIRDKIKKADKE